MMNAVTRDVRIEELVPGDTRTHEAVVRLLVDAFGDAVRYGEERIRSQLQPSTDLFYRRFLVALRGEEVVGAGGIKSADWASDTHLLYLSAVAGDARGQGVGKALVQARISWVEQRFEAGRLLVSTRHKKRFAKLGFKSFSEDRAGERALMIREFGGR